eukprot:scaffold502_cov115-Isochrysis_galbana.AAC.2
MMPCRCVSGGSVGPSASEISPSVSGLKKRRMPHRSSWSSVSRLTDGARAVMPTMWRPRWRNSRSTASVAAPSVGFTAHEPWNASHTKHAASQLDDRSAPCWCRALARALAATSAASGSAEMSVSSRSRYKVSPGKHKDRSELKSGRGCTTLSAAGL